MVLCQNMTHSEWRSCLRDFFLAKPFTPVEITVLTIAYRIITIFGLFGNGLVIYVVARKPHMRTARNVFITNLALSNFLLAAITIPFLWVPSYQIEFNHSAFFCKVAHAFPGINIFCSTLTISVIAVDRYVMVASSTFSGNQMKLYLQISIAVCIWILAFLLSLPYLLFQDVRPLEIPAEMASQFGFPATVLYQYCAFSPPCPTDKDETERKGCVAKYELAVSLILVIFLYFVPLTVVFAFNYMLTNFLKKSEMSNIAVRKTTASYGENSVLQIDQAVKVTSEKQVARPSRFSVSVPRAHSLSRRRRNRTTALLFAMAVSYALLWLPFIVLSLHIHLTGVNEVKSVDEAFKLVTMLSTCVNPLLYGFLNTNFNREFNNIFENVRRVMAEFFAVFRRSFGTRAPQPRESRTEQKVTSLKPIRRWAARFSLADGMLWKTHAIDSRGRRGRQSLPSKSHVDVELLKNPVTQNDIRGSDGDQRAVMTDAESGVRPDDIFV